MPKAKKQPGKRMSRSPIAILVIAALCVSFWSMPEAGAARAAVPTLKTPGHSNATIEGAQEGKHTITFGSLRELECEVATFSGTLAGESNSTLELAPSYENARRSRSSASPSR